MPRTKRVQAPKCVEPKEKESKVREETLKLIQKEEKRIMALIDLQMEKELKGLKLLYATVKTKYPLHMLNRLIGDICSGELDSTYNSTKSFKKNNLTMSTTRTQSSRKRSVSLCCDDEGYTTAESTRGTTSGDRTVRRSRAKTKTVPPKSRSLSRTTAKKAPFITPANKKPLSEAGSITPKCKPNTPQIIVRRPKIGEMAWSNQGSPLLTTHTITAEQSANVNIPLPDGNVVSLLPQRGVRVSQIPEINEDTRRQLLILRDNLIKVCSAHDY